MQLSGSQAGAHPLDRLLALNLDTYLLDDLLVKTDRMSMAHGLEVRSPSSTTATRVRDPTGAGLKVRGLSLKRVLKRAVADLLPDEILGRRKHGFGVPLDRWFREDLAPYTAAVLGPGAICAGGSTGTRSTGCSASTAKAAKPRTRAVDAAHARAVPQAP